VLFVGTGPASLAGAVRLASLALETGVEISVAVIEKAAHPGAHSLSGAVLDPRALALLFPDYRKQEFPLEQEEVRDAFYYLPPAAPFARRLSRPPFKAGTATLSAFPR
jgi:electron-transferring-flavoprotein dehydrogenase